jgi:histidyl-tRNA synthetase
MIRLKDTTHSSTADFLRSAVRIAEYYGFDSLDAMKSGRLDKNVAFLKPENEIAFARRDERALAAAAKRCAMVRRGSTDHLLGWRVVGGTGAIPSTVLELHVVGAASAVAEALLLAVVNSVAEEAGLSERRLLVNNIGSHESSNRFVRDVGLYLRKHIESISPTLRPRAAVDPLGALVQLIERGHPAVPRAPQSMEYLTEEERRRFWELLEYLESYGLAYELSPHVLGSRDCWSHSLFEVSAAAGETGERVTIAVGGRFDPLATRFAGTHTPAATVSIHCETRGKTSVKRETRGMPSIYFAHLGPEARRRTLTVLEELRRAEIPVHQSLLFERIGEQMSHARQYAVPYILIMGYKEAMENTVLVREVATNSQEAVPVDDLANYLRRRRMGSWKELSIR